MEYTYIPKQCKGDDASFDGKVKLKGLGFDKVMDLLELMQQAQVTPEEQKEDPLKPMRALRKLVADTKGQWVECDLKHKESGTELKSVDDCYSFNPAFGVLVDVAQHLVDSSSLGK